MFNKSFIFILSFLLISAPAFAKEYVEQAGLFRMDIPEGWHWVESVDEVVIAYPGGKTMAIDIQWIPSDKLSAQEVKTKLKQGNDKMIQQGILAHQGKLIDEKDIKVDGVYATQVDFTTRTTGSMVITYISFYYQENIFSITYSGSDENTLLVLDDMVESFKFQAR